MCKFPPPLFPFYSTGSNSYRPNFRLPSKGPSVAPVKQWGQKAPVKVTFIVPVALTLTGVHFWPQGEHSHLLPRCIYGLVSGKRCSIHKHMLRVQLLTLHVKPPEVWDRKASRLRSTWAPWERGHSSAHLQCLSANPHPMCLRNFPAYWFLFKEEEEGKAAESALCFLKPAKGMNSTTQGSEC